MVILRGVSLCVCSLDRPPLLSTDPTTGRPTVVLVMGAGLGNEPDTHLVKMEI